MRTLRAAALYTSIAGERLALDVRFLTRACFVIPAIPRCGWAESHPRIWASSITGLWKKCQAKTASTPQNIWFTVLILSISSSFNAKLPLQLQLPLALSRLTPRNFRQIPRNNFPRRAAMRAFVAEILAHAAVERGRGRRERVDSPGAPFARPCAGSQAPARASPFAHRRQRRCARHDGCKSESRGGASLSWPLRLLCAFLREQPRVTPPDRKS